MTSVPSAPSGATTDQACPYLGLAGDPASHFAFPSGAQRCHAGGHPTPLAPAKQARDCLTSQHVTCPLYRPGTAPTARAGLPGPPVAVITSVVRPGERAAPRATGGRRPPAGSVGRRVLVSGIVAGTVVGGLIIGSWLASGAGGPVPSAGGPGSGGPASATTVIPSGSSGPATESPPSASASPSRPPSAGPSPSPSPSPSPRPSPSGPLIHVVERNENLTVIAKRYGVTVKAIQEANDIKDPNLIFAGQRLVIPKP